jgi:hypothetical protein
MLPSPGVTLTYLEYRIKLILHIIEGFKAVYTVYKSTRCGSAMMSGNLKRVRASGTTIMHTYAHGQHP